MSQKIVDQFTVTVKTVVHGQARAMRRYRVYMAFGRLLRGPIERRQRLIRTAAAWLARWTRKAIKQIRIQTTIVEP